MFQSGESQLVRFLLSPLRAFCCMVKSWHQRYGSSDMQQNTMTYTWIIKVYRGLVTLQCTEKIVFFSSICSLLSERTSVFSPKVKALTSEQCRCVPVCLMSPVIRFHKASCSTGRNMKLSWEGPCSRYLWFTKGSLPSSSEMSCGVSFMYRIWIRIRITPS